MTKIKCNFCSSENYQPKKIDYLYQYQGKYLLIPNTPVEICQDCGMIYYPAKVMKKIEQDFFSIYENKEKPDQYLSIPSKSFS
jgi:YgiT-type zinc finger domain-containing protein